MFQWYVGAWAIFLACSSFRPNTSLHALKSRVRALHTAQCLTNQPEDPAPSWTAAQAAVLPPESCRRHSTLDGSVLFCATAGYSLRVGRQHENRSEQERVLATPSQVPSSGRVAHLAAPSAVHRWLCACVTRIPAQKDTKPIRRAACVSAPRRQSPGSRPAACPLVLQAEQSNAPNRPPKATQAPGSQTKSR